MARQWMSDINDVRARLLTELPELAEMPPADREPLLEEARQRAERATWLNAYSGLATIGSVLLGLVCAGQTLMWLPPVPPWMPPAVPWLREFLVVVGWIGALVYGIYRLVLRPLKSRAVSRELWPLMTTRCGACGYDLTGNTSGTCPECGLDVAERRSPASRAAA